MAADWCVCYGLLQVEPKRDFEPVEVKDDEAHSVE